MTAKVSYCAIQENETASIKIEASPRVTKVKISEPLEISISISNISDSTKMIGTEMCGVHKLLNWVTDDKSVEVADNISCRINVVPPQDIILKSGEIYEQICVVRFIKKKAKPGPFIFRLGVQLMGGQLVTWSNQVTVEILPKDQDFKIKL